jgi:hypothetical protein
MFSLPGNTILGLGREGPLPSDYRLDAGAVLSRTFSIWASCLVPFVVLGLVLHLPLLLGPWLARLPSSRGLQEVVRWLTWSATSLVGLALEGAVTYGVLQKLKQRPASLSSILHMGLFRIGPVFLVSLLRGAVMAVGLLLCIVPGFIILCVQWVAIPVAVIESPGASASLRRSSALTQGNGWPIFGVVVVLSLVGTAAGFLFRRGLVALGVGPASAEYGVILTLLMIPVRCLHAIAPAVGYHDLRVGREGADVDELLRVFE